MNERGVGLVREHTSSGPIAFHTYRMCNTCLLFKHPDTTITQYKEREMKHLKQTSEILAKTHEEHLKTIANICNIQMKYL
jgi:hypothetical protein